VPLTTGTITVNCPPITPKPGAEYPLKATFELTKDELWAKKGYTVAEEQFTLSAAKPEMAKLGEPAIKVARTDGTITLTGQDSSAPSRLD
jgi:beta-galactosidase